MNRTLMMGSVRPPSTIFVKTTIANVVVMMRFRETEFASGKCKLCAKATAPLKPEKVDSNQYNLFNFV